MSEIHSEPLLPQLIIGCGYLGRRVAAQWQTSGRAVIAVTRSPERANQFRRDGLIPYVGDICRPETLTELPEVDRVLFAVGFDRNSGRSQEEVFVEGLQQVLQHISLRCKRFLYISSTSVYGQHDGEWVDETSPCEPVQPGGRCCLAAEKLVQEYCSQQPGEKWTYSILRLAGIYGPGRLLSRIADLQAGQSLSGRPDAWLNLIHVEDAVTAVLAAARAEVPSSTYIVADDRPLQRGEYYRQLADLVGAPPPRFDESLLRSRGSGELNKRCSNRKLRTELGVTLRYPTITEGLPAALHADG